MGPKGRRFEPGAAPWKRGLIIPGQAVETRFQRLEGQENAIVPVRALSR